MKNGARYSDLGERLKANSVIQQHRDRHGMTWDCWVWQAQKKPASGGRLYAAIGIYCKAVKKCKTMLAHRESFKFFKGELLPDMQIDHICENTICVNPAHLEQITRDENLAKRHCRWHTLSGEDYVPEILSVEENFDAVFW